MPMPLSGCGYFVSRPARTRMLVGDDVDVDVDSDALVYVDVMELGAGR